MAKTTFSLPNNTVVTVEGELDEIKALLDYYSRPISISSSQNSALTGSNSKVTPKPHSISEEQVNYVEIINLIKSCKEAEAIEHRILDKSSELDRTLLPLYIVQKYLENKFSLTSGDISKINMDLGVKITQPQVSRTLSGSASRYVAGDKVKKKGIPVKYKITRKGVTYLELVLSQETNDKS